MKDLNKTVLEKPTHEPVFIPKELYVKLENHANQKGVSVDIEAIELLNVAIKFLDALTAAKSFMKGGNFEL